MLKARGGFTLIEMMMGASIMGVVSAALIGAFLGQTALNATARNLTAAMTDATRVMEEMRTLNSGVSCASGVPSAKPSDHNSWDEWLTAQVKSIPTNADTGLELIALTCQDGSVADCTAGDELTCLDEDETKVTCPSAGGTPVECPGEGIKYAPVRYCKQGTQVGTGEWQNGPGSPDFDPIRVTVAVCWVYRNHAFGGPDCVYTPEQKKGSGKLQVITPAKYEVQDTNGDGLITSQAMISTLVTCR